MNMCTLYIQAVMSLSYIIKKGRRNVLKLKYK